MIVRDLIYGWEHGIVYVPGDVTRGQAKALVAWETDAAFTDLRCRAVWMQSREISEQEAEDSWLDDWEPGYVAWVECRADAKGAKSFWKVDTESRARERAR